MIYTERQVREAIRKERYRYGSDAEMARDIRVDKSSFSRMLRRKRPVSDKVLRFLGFKRIIAYTGTGT